MALRVRGSSGGSPADHSGWLCAASASVQIRVNRYLLLLSKATRPGECLCGRVSQQNQVSTIDNYLGCNKLKCRRVSANCR